MRSGNKVTSKCGGRITESNKLMTFLLKKEGKVCNFEFFT